MRLALVLEVGLALLNACVAGGSSGQVTVGRSKDQSAQNTRACGVHDLLPLPCQSKSSEWSDEYVTEPVYDCSCATMKARYFCPTQGSSNYPKWEPRAVSEGLCRSKMRGDMVGAPLPPNAKILFYGNSHLRQVVEAFMCMFQEDLASKRVALGIPGVETTVDRDMQCRACSTSNDPDWVSPLQKTLLKHQCIGETDTCRCGDSEGEYMFPNGAVVHFQFSHTQKDKGIADARKSHGMDDLSSYDAVFLNPGNTPPIGAAKAVNIALEVQAAGTQVFWLSTYYGSGQISKWSKDQRTRFNNSGALFVDIECMARGLTYLTKGAVEGEKDFHFCLPGPPNEIALLLLKMIWAMFEESE